jgi:hypothetical protein
MSASSDLIVEVARAADPAQSASVTRRLEALAQDGATPATNFAATLAATSAAAPASAPPIGQGLGNARFAFEGAGSAADRTSQAHLKFEAALLNNFVSEMLPKNADSVYGEGYAGDMWRSLLAQTVSEQIAKSGALGIARRLFDGGHAPTSEKLQTINHGADQLAQATATSRNALSLPQGAEVGAGDYLFARGKAL